MAGVVAQLVERLLPTPEVRGSNPPAIFYLFDIYLFTVNCIEKTKIKIKRPGMALLLKTFFAINGQCSHAFKNFF